jgi:Cys-tRNA(Pro)/Cys-tRNA(Cys) deacylase
VKTKKTNAVRILEKEGAAFELRSFSYKEVPSAVEVARILDLPPEIVYKTLVTTNGHPKGIFVFVIPGPAELDLKKAAKAAGEKSLSMLKSKELLQEVGYVHGGCSPIGLKRPYPVFLDESALKLEKICFSAGEIGFQIITAPQVLMKTTGAKSADVLA